MRITEADARALGRKREQPVREAGELLAVFVAGKLVNTKNARLHYKSESRYKRGWRDRVAMVLLETAGWLNQKWTPATPKLVTFHAFTHATMDDDGLAVACAPIRDALIECGVIHGDSPAHWHRFVYTQQIDRTRRGCEIRVRPFA